MTTVPSAPTTAPRHRRLTAGQRATWLVEQLADGRGTRHPVRAWWLDGKLDDDRLARAVAGVMDRNQTLRTAFGTAGSGPVARVAATVRPDLLVLDSSDRSDDDCQLQAGVDASAPFDLFAAPLLRVRVYRKRADRQLLLLVTHEIVCADSSLDIVAREIAREYQCPDSSNAIVNADIDIDAGESALATTAAPAIAWPGRRSPRRSPAARPLRTTIPASTLHAVTEFAARADADPGTVALAALRVLLCRHTRQPDLSIAVSSARTADDVGPAPAASLRGGDLTGEETFRELVRVEQANASAPAAMSLPPALASVASAAGLAVRQVTFDYRDRPPYLLELPGLVAETAEVAAAIDGDLAVAICADPDVAVVTWHAGAALDEDSVAGLAVRFAPLLDAALREPDRVVTALPPLIEADRQAIAAIVGDPDTGAEPGETVVDLVRGWVLTTPDAVAVRAGAQSRTYADVWSCSGRIAARLLDLGIEAETPVGILVHRGVDLPAVLLGIARAGGVCLPLDPTHPRERHRYVLTDADARILITDGAFDEAPEAPDMRVVRLDDMLAPLAGSATVPERLDTATIDGGRLAYILFTSGSTGEPKGVGVTHAGLANCLRATRDLMDCRPGQSLLAITTITFDIAALELLVMLTAGGHTIVASHDEQRNGELLRDALRRWRPDFIQATPITVRMLFVCGWEGDPDLVVSCGGDVVDPALAARLAACTKVVWHTYGPTEASLYTICEPVRVGPQPSIVPVGRALPNTRMHILDDHGRTVPPGDVGELCIGGIGVARGYLGRPGLTAQRFIPDRSTPGQRLYRTGDLARMRPDGRIELRGRADRQVKIRGHRIEPGEIETVLARHPDVAVAAVAIVGENADNRRIAAYLQPRISAAGQPEDLVGAVTTHVRAVLPAHMVPASFAVVAKIPVNAHGKVDRRALPAPQPPAARTPARRPADPDALAITALFADVLGAAPGAPDFLTAGGDLDGLIAVRDRLARDHGMDIRLADIAAAPTVEALTIRMRAERTRRGASGRSGVDGVRLARSHAFGRLPLLVFVGDAPSDGSGNAPGTSVLDARYDTLFAAVETDRPVVSIGVATSLPDPAGAADSLLAELLDVENAGRLVTGGVIFGGHGRGVPLALALATAVRNQLDRRPAVIIVDGPAPDGRSGGRYRGPVTYLTPQRSGGDADSWRAIGRSVSVLTVPGDRDTMFDPDTSARIAGVVSGLG